MTLKQDRVNPNGETDINPFTRVLALIDALPAEFRPSDDTPLREAMPGGWPTIGEFRKLINSHNDEKMRRALDLLVVEAESIGQYLVHNAPTRDFSEATKNGRALLCNT